MPSFNRRTQYIEGLEIELRMKIDLEVAEILDVAIGGSSFCGYTADEFFPEDTESFASYLASVSRHSAFLLYLRTIVERAVRGNATKPGGRSGMAVVTYHLLHPDYSLTSASWRSDNFLLIL
jgi:hypothetical protein